MSLTLLITMLLGFTFSISIAVSIGGSAILGLTFFDSGKLILVPKEMFTAIDKFPLAAIPFFILAGNLMETGGISRRLVNFAKSLVGGVQGGLPMTCVLTCMIFAAVSGSSVATTFAIGSILIPALIKHGYPVGYAASLQATSAELGVIIPPSIPMILYGVAAEVSIGELFIAGVVPGLLIGAALMLFVHLWCRFKGLGKNDGDDRLGVGPATRDAGWALLMPVVILGGIYGGIITVAEAGAIGAFTALVGMVAMRRVTLKDITISMGDSVKVTGMLMMLVIGAQIMARFLAFSRVPRELVALLEPILDQPYLLISMLMGLFFFAGMILESAAVIVLLVPMLLPLLQAAQIDLLWFGVMASFMIALGLLTPPVGLSVYAAASAARFPVAEVFRPTTVFAVAAGLIVTAAMMIFPGLVTWLPSHIQ